VVLKCGGQGAPDAAASEIAERSAGERTGQQGNS